MATKTKMPTTENNSVVTKYKGSQLLRMAKYNTTVARVVIKPNEDYSFEEADVLISDFMKKKG